MSTTTTRTDLRAIREKVIREHVEAECRHDILATLATATATATVADAGERLVKKTVFFDHATMLAQIGVGR